MWTLLIDGYTGFSGNVDGYTGFSGNEQEAVLYWLGEGKAAAEAISGGLCWMWGAARDGAGTQGRGNNFTTALK